MKTSIEWLQEALSLTFEQEMKFEGLFQQAKEMEKQQIIDAVNFGDERGKISTYLTGEQYYKQTFKKL